MKVTWEVALATCFISLFLITWLYLAIKRNHFSFHEIGRVKLNEATNDVMVTSPYLPPRALAMVRLLCLLWLCIVLISVPITGHGNQWHIPLLAWYTVWNWLLLCLFFLFSTTLTFLHATQYKWCCIKRDKVLNRLRIVTWIVFQMECSLVLLVDVVVWCLLVPFADAETRKSALLTFPALSMHTTNSIVIYLELCISNIPLKNFHHGWFCMILPFLYVIFEWIINSCCHIYFSYPFVDPGNVWNAIFYLAIFAMHLVCWTVSYKFKRVVVEKWMRKSVSMQDRHPLHDIILDEKVEPDTERNADSIEERAVTN